VLIRGLYLYGIGPFFIGFLTLFKAVAFQAINSLDKEEKENFNVVNPQAYSTDISKSLIRGRDARVP
jgi:hypothetical protein